jgi:metallophosphoesterase (TIGR00282 family)
MIGDVVGESGLEVLENRLPFLIKEFSLDFVTVNGENAAGGFGLTDICLKRIFAAGVDVVTGGNHIWEKREFWPILDEEERVLRPMNYPSGSAGRGWVKIEKPSPCGTVSWVILNLQGRELMNPLDCPFRAFDLFEKGLNSPEKPLILLDFHAESSREKEALAYYLDGRASVIAGTHAHVQTTDERILPNGSAYITDLGMTGILDGIIGMDTTICINRARNQVLYRMEAAVSNGKAKTAVQGIIAEIDAETRKAVSIKRISC